MSEQPSEAQLLRAEVQALRQSVWNLEQMALAQQEQADAQRGKPGKVVVTNFNIGFWAMVNLMVTAAIASIPALIILILIGAIFWTVILALLTNR